MIRESLERARWMADDLDLLEINEAFATQPCAANQETGRAPDRSNVNGGLHMS